MSTQLLSHMIPSILTPPTFTIFGAFRGEPSSLYIDNTTRAEATVYIVESSAGLANNDAGLQSQVGHTSVGS